MYSNRLHSEHSNKFVAQRRPHLESLSKESLLVLCEATAYHCQVYYTCWTSTAADGILRWLSPAATAAMAAAMSSLGSWLKEAACPFSVGRGNVSHE